jgi:hypothetical protein
MADVLTVAAADMFLKKKTTTMENQDNFFHSNAHLTNKTVLESVRYSPPSATMRISVMSGEKNQRRPTNLLKILFWRKTTPGFPRKSPRLGNLQTTWIHA